MAADSVKEIKKQRGSYLVMLASGDSLRVPLAVFRALPLREGEPVDIAAYRQAQLQAEYPLAMERAGRVLSQRDYSEQMLERKLLEVGYLPQTCARVVERLRGLGYLDDARYAQNLLERKKKRSGTRGIAQQLRLKGVDKAVTEEVLAGFSAQEELAAACAQAQKYVANKPWERRDACRRCIAFLSRRGYPYDVARAAAEKATGEEAPDYEG